MSENPDLEGLLGGISIHLLDSATGHAIQTWKFEGQPLIRIGRSEDNHVVIPDPSVSRLHAELRYMAGSWNLVNSGKNGILLSGKRASQVQLCEHTTFRLGPTGPLLRFDGRQTTSVELNTITSEPSLLRPSIQVDEMQRDLRVREIAESEYFQQLQRMSQKLRNQASKPRLP
jgi:pSer/pThr/pTyr-binding forkhead associated (FHA) protein